MIRSRGWPAIALLPALLLGLPSSAHKPSDSYLTLEIRNSRVAGRWDIALRDLDYVIGLDRDGNGSLTWGEVRARRADVEAYAFARLKLVADGVGCSIHGEDYQAVRHSDGAYAVLQFVADCRDFPRALDVDYQLLFDRDPQHRGLTQIIEPGGTRTLLFSDRERKQRLEIGRSHSSPQLLQIVREGVRHIWNGWDHLLFLIALLLPSVLRRHQKGWEPLPRWRPALNDVLKIVTAFTVAHSLTLSLAALDVVRLPSRLVESGIAASVLLAALNNVVPVLRGDRWAAAFVLGLLHGFGFSATLVDLGLPRELLLKTLFGFNLGVELGQLAVVGALFPLAFLARKSVGYRRVVLLGGSILTASVAGVWLVERALVVRIFPA